MPFRCPQVLSDEGKRKQYDTYGSAGFDAGQAGAGHQQYWGGGASIDPEELFRKIFGEFSGARGFGDFNAIFDQPQEVRYGLLCRYIVFLCSRCYGSWTFILFGLHFSDSDSSFNGLIKF